MCFCLQVFHELFDLVISDRHSGYGPHEIHNSDLEYTKVTSHVTSSQLYAACHYYAHLRSLTTLRSRCRSMSILHKKAFRNLIPLNIFPGNLPRRKPKDCQMNVTLIYTRMKKYSKTGTEEVQEVIRHA